MRNDSGRCVDKDTEKISRRNIGRTASDTGADTGRTVLNTTTNKETGTPLMRAYVRAALTGLDALLVMLLLTHGRYFKWYFFPMSSTRAWISSTALQRRTGLIHMERFIPCTPHCAISFS